jgi:hypothetical protein
MTLTYSQWLAYVEREAAALDWDGNLSGNTAALFRLMLLERRLLLDIAEAASATDEDETSVCVERWRDAKKSGLL